MSFLAFAKKNLQATHTWKFVTLLNIFLRMPLGSFFNLVLPPLIALLGHTVQNIFFALLKFFSPKNCNLQFMDSLSLLSALFHRWVNKGFDQIRGVHGVGRQYLRLPNLCLEFLTFVSIVLLPFYSFVPF